MVWRGRSRSRSRLKVVKGSQTVAQVVYDAVVGVFFVLRVKVGDMKQEKQFVDFFFFQADSLQVAHSVFGVGLVLGMIVAVQDAFESVTALSEGGLQQPGFVGLEKRTGLDPHKIEKGRVARDGKTGGEGAFVDEIVFVAVSPVVRESVNRFEIPPRNGEYATQRKLVAVKVTDGSRFRVPGRYQMAL